MVKFVKGFRVLAGKGNGHHNHPFMPSPYDILQKPFCLRLQPLDRSHFALITQGVLNSGEMLHY
jgi:hypothetical protein